MKIIFYTDGSSINNQDAKKRVGGCAAVQSTLEVLNTHGEVIYHSNDREFYTYKKGATNSEMEIAGALIAVMMCPKGTTSLIIRTDSTYVMRTINEWYPTWVAKGTVKAHMDLWHMIHNLAKSRGFTIRAEKVKGHSGDKNNDRCDFLATEASSKCISNIPNITNQEAIISSTLCFHTEVEDKFPSFIGAHGTIVVKVSETAEEADYYRHAGMWEARVKRDEDNRLVTSDGERLNLLPATFDEWVKSNDGYISNDDLEKYRPKPVNFKQSF